MLFRSVERLQSHVLWREAALAGHIDDEQRLAAVDVHLLWLAVDRDQVDVVEAHRFRISAWEKQGHSTFLDQLGLWG